MTVIMDISFLPLLELHWHVVNLHVIIVFVWLSLVTLPSSQALFVWGLSTD